MLTYQKNSQLKAIIMKFNEKRKEKLLRISKEFQEEEDTEINKLTIRSIKNFVEGNNLCYQV
jgi:hypothetical protein